MTTETRLQHHRIRELCLMLAKVLEQTPPTTFDESPLATWVDTVDKLTRELVKEFGRTDAVSVVLNNFAELNAKYDAVRAFVVQRHGEDFAASHDGIGLWYRVLTDAQQLQNVEHAAIRAYEAERDKNAGLESALDQQVQRTLELQREIMVLRHAQMPPESTSSRRFKTVSAA